MSANVVFGRERPRAKSAFCDWNFSPDKCTTMDCVKLKFIDPEKSQISDESLLYWPASHVPKDVQFSRETNSKTKQTTITAKGHVNFSSTQANDDDVNYFIARRGPNGKLICQPAQMYRMFPNYAFKDEALETENEDTNRLTRREQLDELKEKFGSRRSQRDLGLFILLLLFFPSYYN